jgi:phosphoribosylglycinamide formyltransferase-1
MRLGVLVSGNGTNLQALLDACASDEFPAEVAVVISNVRDAFALERARRAGVLTEILEHQRFETRERFDEQLISLLRQNCVDAVCLAGFMRLLSPAFVRAFPGRVLNIHPSLLPAFPGLHAVRQALHHGVKIAGCSVHFVDEGLDSGAIIAQAAVAVVPNETEESLAQRILVEEHRIYPAAVRWLAEERLSIRGRCVDAKGTSAPQTQVLRSPDFAEVRK